MADKRFTQLNPMTPKQNMAFHVIDLDDNRDKHIDQSDFDTYVQGLIPEGDDFHDYPGYTSSSLPNDALVAVEKGDFSGYGNINVLALKRAFFDFSHPVGTVYENYSDSRNPSTIFGVGTWVSLGQGKCTLGVGSGSDINAINLSVSQGETGGEYVVILEENEIPKHTHGASISPNPHNHQVYGASGGSGGVTTNDGVGSSVTTSSTLLHVTVQEQVTGDQPHNNIPPYVAVYRWRRTA